MINKKKVNGREFWEFRARLGGRNGEEVQVKRRFNTREEAQATFMRLKNQFKGKMQHDEKGGQIYD